jgi:hypothetical protein
VLALCYTTGVVGTKDTNEGNAMIGLNWIVTGFGGGSREVPAGGFKTRPMAWADVVILAVGAVAIAGVTVGFVLSLL